MPRQLVICLVVAKYWKLKKIQMEVEAREEAERAAAQKVLTAFNMLSAFTTRLSTGSTPGRSNPLTPKLFSSGTTPMHPSMHGDSVSAVPPQAHSDIAATPLRDSKAPGALRWRAAGPRLTAQAPQSTDAPASLVGAADAPDPPSPMHAPPAVAFAGHEDLAELFKGPSGPPDPASDAAGPEGVALGESYDSRQLPVSTGVLRRTSRASRTSHCSSEQAERVTHAARPSAPFRQTQATAAGFLHGVLRSGARWAWPQLWEMTTPPQHSRSAQGSPENSSNFVSAASRWGLELATGVQGRAERSGAEGSGMEGYDGEEPDRESCASAVAAMERLERRRASPRCSTGSRGVH